MMLVPRYRSKCFLFFTLLLFFTVALPSLSGQTPKDTASIKVMLLGTVHLDNPGRDLNNPEVPDVLSPQKQKELAELRNSLQEFKPTKIALEVRKEHQAAFDSVYQTFRTSSVDSFSVGDFKSKRSEHFQIGFKLANELNHPHVWAVDYFEVGMQMGNVLSFAKRHDPEMIRYVKAFKDGFLMSTINDKVSNGTVTELYQFLNNPQTIPEFRKPNTRMATVGNDTSYVGAEVVAQYHKRNLMIFANIEQIAESGDRILVIFGAGHQPYLRPLIKHSPQMEFVDPLDYL